MSSYQKISDTEGNFTGALANLDGFGRSVAVLGDLDGDGVDELAVGAWEAGIGDTGVVWVLFLDSDGTVKSQREIGQAMGGFGGDLDAGDRFGVSVASVGDLDGDGVSDLAVGAIGDDDGGLDRGAVWMLFLDSDGTVKSLQKIADNQGGFTGTLDNFDRFGSSVASLGDLDGDGVGDLAVGALGDDNAVLQNAGAVWVLFLDTDGTVKSHHKLGYLNGGFLGYSTSFGSSVASLGDLDGDGVNDLVVGAMFDDDDILDPENQGAAWVLLLDTDGSVKSQRRIGNGSSGFTGVLDAQDNFGSSVASLGDLDGDGVNDLAVGARGDDDGGTDRGAVWVFFLEASGAVKSQEKISSIEGGFTGDLDNHDSFGGSMAFLGDLDGDGAGDLAVGAECDDDGGSDRGAVWVLFLQGDLVRLGFETEDDFATPLLNGQAIAPPQEFGRLVDVEGFGLHNYGTAIFDSTPGGPNAASTDPDLLVGRGNLLILQEDQHQTVPGFFDQPDDAQLGGTMVFDFLQPVDLRSVDLVDIDLGPPIQDVVVTLFDSTGAMRNYFVPDGWTTDFFRDGPPGFGTLDLTTLELQPGFMSTATASETVGFDPMDVTRLEVFFSSSGALDDLVFDPHPCPTGP